MAYIKTRMENILHPASLLCLVRKSVDRQIQHFLVKCVKKSNYSADAPM